MYLAGHSHLIWHSSFVDLPSLKLLEGERNFVIVFSELVIHSLMYGVLNKLPTTVNKVKSVGWQQQAHTFHYFASLFFAFYPKTHRKYYLCQYTQSIFCLHHKNILYSKPEVYFRCQMTCDYTSCFSWLLLFPQDNLEDRGNVTWDITR